MRTNRRLAACLIATGTAATLCVLRGDAQRAADGSEFRERRSDPVSDRYLEVCATDRVRAARLALEGGIAIRDVLPDGRPVSFEQDPAILMPDHRGTITFRNFLVAGDVDSIRFKLGDPDASDIETWSRTGTRTINGRLVSVFEPRWDSATLARLLRRRTWGFDSPMLYWGELLPAGVEEGKGFFIRVRFSSTRLPDSQVRRLASDVQYASHVVNIVLPGFGDSRLGRDERAFPWRTLTQKFYEHFEGSYDTIAVTMQDMHVSGASAFHFNVKNEVRGIGENVFDQAASYGSPRLRSIEFYYGNSITANRTTAHELAHQWGSYFDWDRIAKTVTRAGHQPQSHDPLFAEGETLIGSILDATRRVKRVSDGWQIERTPEVIRFHPLTRYAMGILPRDAVPALTLFSTQNQFDDDFFPEPGTQVTGATEDITISHIAAVAGERSGPVDSDWHRAVVVVSRDLLSQREMNYWNFFAQRTEDPNRTGVVSYDGFGSFDYATERRIDVHHEIRPLNGQQISQSLPVDAPELGHDDFRDVRFEAPVPTSYAIGQQVRLSGRLLSSDRSDYSQALVRFWRYGGTSDDSIRVWSSITSSGSFSVEHQWQAGQQGRYTMEVFLFWSGAPAQFPRVIAGPIIVN